MDRVQVSAESDLVPCSFDNNGVSVYVINSDAVYTCLNGDWINQNTGLVSGGNLIQVSAESDLVPCSFDNNGVSVYVINSNAVYTCLNGGWINQNSGLAYSSSSSSALFEISSSSFLDTAVDLRLPSGTKWANINVGAKKPEDSGDYFAWGEIEPKAEYTTENCQTCGNSNLGDIAGNANYDAATANWGVKWKMPTYEQMDELGSKCTWEWTTKNGVDGAMVTGPNGNSIFLPAAGNRGDSLLDVGSRGYYWSSTPATSNYAYIFNFLSGYSTMKDIHRRIGLSVRPVLAE